MVETETPESPQVERGLSVFERYLTLWVILCIIAGIILGKVAPGVAKFLDGLAIYVGDAPVVSIPVAICLFFMMYPIMVKIDFGEVLRAGRNLKPVGLTLFVNWAIKPFTMYAISIFFLGTLFLGFIGPDAVDNLKMPLGVSRDVGATYGAGKVVLVDGVKMLQVPLWRSYLWGCILLGIAPCTAMVFVWSQLTRGDPTYTLVQVSVNDLIMVVAFAPIVAFLLGVTEIVVPWETLVLATVLYVVLPLIAGLITRRVLGSQEAIDAFTARVKPWSAISLIATVVILFGLQGEVILARPLVIALIAVPILIQSYGIFAIAYGAAYALKVPHRIAAPCAMIGTSNFFELAVAVAISLFGLHSGAALATVVGVLVEVPVMLSLVAFANRTRTKFAGRET